MLFQHAINQEVVLRLVFATLLGSIFGLNRDFQGKPAGLRTLALVSLGTAMATLIILGNVSSDHVEHIDALSRVMQGILTGIGFLGAGVIIRDADGHVSGLTTAATIWIAAILGVLCGMGDWALASMASVLVISVLTFGGVVERAAERLFNKTQRNRSDKTND